MNSRIAPALIESVPFEVAMDGYLVTAFALINLESNQNLAPDRKFKNFLENSPNKEFSILVSWNSVRDDADMSLIILNNLDGQINSLGPIHSIPTEIRWLSDDIIHFVVRVRPSISNLKNSSEYDLAKPTVVSVSRENGHFKIAYLGYSNL